MSRTKGAKAPKKPAKPKPRGVIQVRVSDDERAVIDRAATRDHLTLSAWVRQQLLRAAEAP